MGDREIPAAVAAVVGEVIGSYYYNHRRINTLFLESGAPGEPPDGNCAEKCTAWLKRCNSTSNVDALNVLGRVLLEFMEIDENYDPDQFQLEGRGRIKEVLAKYGLSYHQNGVVIGTKTGIPTRSLEFILRNRNLAALEIEFERTLTSIEADPPASLTAACSMVEALFKVYIEDENLEMPSQATIKKLWSVVQADLRLDPASLQDDDLKRILSGLTSIVDGLGSIRTHSGSAHGRGRKSYRVASRHARLVVHSAHSLAVFIIETWDAKKK